VHFCFALLDQAHCILQHFLSLSCYCAAGGHTDVVKLLLHYGAKTEMTTKNGMMPIDLAGYGTDCWHVLHTAEYGILPELPSQDDVVPIIPWYALRSSSDTDDKSKINKKKGQKTRQKTRK